MEVGASCYSLAAIESAAQKRKDEKIAEIIVSCTSLSQYERKANLKAYFPQVLAALFASFFHVSVGMSLAYSAVLIPQLEDPNSNLKATEEEASWIASCLMLMMPIGNISGGILIDKIGRLNTLKLAVIPTCLGYVLIATANNIPMLLIGRLFTGLSCAWGANPAAVFITEIASPQVRGTLVSISQTFTALGMVLVYLLGWILHWRIVAWIGNVLPIMAGLSLLVIPESPAWLVSKGHPDRAKKSLQWYYKNFPELPNRKKDLADMQLDLLIQEHEQKKAEQVSDNESEFRKFARGFMKPTGYKPFLIMFGVFVVQQFTGIYIMLFYAVTFIKVIGSDLDPYGASVFIGFVRFLMSIVGTLTLKKCTRRGLLIWSSLGMSVCIGLSGLFTSFIKDGQIAATWVPILFILLYMVASSFGLLTLPWIMAAELYPIEIRGIAHSLTMSVAHVLMFLAIKLYFSLETLFGGPSGVQYFFAAVSLVSVVYIFVFLPETKDKKLSEIEKYFKEHTVYLGVNNSSAPPRNAMVRPAKGRGNIVKASPAKNRKDKKDEKKSKEEQTQNMMEIV